LSRENRKKRHAFRMRYREPNVPKVAREGALHERGAEKCNDNKNIRRETESGLLKKGIEEPNQDFC